MIYFPSCKINLGLHILQKREDGYHELETGMLEIPFRDILEIVPATTFQFTSSGLSIPGNSNSCIQAYDLLKQEFDLPPVHIHLHKLIPMGGGLGGGSSDSTNTLMALNELFQLGLTDNALMEMAAKLGSDNAFFVRGGLQLATGRGEILEPLESQARHLHLCVVNIGIHVSTKEAYASVVPQIGRPSIKEVLQLPMELWSAKLVNDFETSVFRIYPELDAIKSDLYAAGATYAAMSGSGSTLFGLFEQLPEEMRWSSPPVYEKWLEVNF